MNVVGLIVEYNPFHNGHLYHLNKTKELYPNSYIICVVSSNFTQRGDVSLIDKWDKTRIALELGIDLVIELPFYYAVQSADNFAKYSIEILYNLGVDTIVFGSELLESKQLESLVNYQLEPKYNEDVKSYMNAGLNYPTAMSKALEEVSNIKIINPNEILGLAYVKTIKLQNYPITTKTITRTNSYHSLTLEEISSATSIRHSLLNKQDVSIAVPKATLPYLNNCHFIQDYFEIIKYKIITSDINYLQTIFQMNEGLEYKLKKHVHEAESIDHLINLVKSKRYTYNRISRLLIYILLDFKSSDFEAIKNLEHIRILGFSKKGQLYLNSLKTDLKLITNLRNNRNYGTDLESKASQIFHLNKPYNDNIGPIL